MERGTPVSPLLSNRYQLQQTLGTGGMAVVYRARDLMLERPVAVKVLRTDFSQDNAFRERFRQEARAAANLSHPNIVTVHDFGLDTGAFYRHGKRARHRSKNHDQAARSFQPWMKPFP
jgi:eukaryotic-like serine/threonine-protein kinase